MIDSLYMKMVDKNIGGVLIDLVLVAYCIRLSGTYRYEVAS